MAAYQSINIKSGLSFIRYGDGLIMNLWLGLGAIILGVVLVACAVFIAFTVVLLKIVIIGAGLIVIAAGVISLLSQPS
jgi:hypothetical protein